jgi:ABC-type multidrug transport system fused ATPase/permease subunit
LTATRWCICLLCLLTVGLVSPSAPIFDEILICALVAVRLELLGSCIVLAAAIFSLVALVTTGVDAGLVGLVLSYGLSTTQSLNWVVRSASEVEQNLVSVERVVE